MEPPMPSHETEKLTELALAAIEEAAAACHLGPVQRTRALALALAYLMQHGRHDGPALRWPFASFWQALAVERQHDRWSAANAAVNAIYRALERPRDPKRQSRFEQAAKHPVRERVG